MDPEFLARTFGLAGRTALVTGSCSGLGLSIAQALGRSGARVVVNGRHAGRCESAVEHLRRAGIATLAAPFDVADEAAVMAAVGQLAAQGVDVDLLVTSAGNQDRRPVTEMTSAQWQALMDVHVNGTFHCAHAVLPGMVSRGWGRIVLMSSVAAQAAMPNIAAYASAKGAVTSFARALAVEYGAHGITANAIAPGFTRTGFTKALQGNADFQEFLAAAVPAGRWAEPDEIAPAVVFLASSAGAFVNGHVLTVDGGLLAHL